VVARMLASSLSAGMSFSEGVLDICQYLSPSTTPDPTDAQRSIPSPLARGEG
jgi:hypothetical protein